jgi:DNA replicative helicase MCM subunit Mcm2 (Cdc46/Mcm family)
MRLRDEVTAEHVDEAHRLFEISTLKAIRGKEMGVNQSPKMIAEIQKVEEFIKRKIPIGKSIEVVKLAN